MGFYLSATFIILGFAANSENLTKMSLLIWICFAALVSAGTILGILLTLYRGWHGCYVISAIVLQELIKQSKQEIPIKFIRDIEFKFNSIISVEFISFLFLQVFIALNISLMYYVIPSGIDYPNMSNMLFKIIPNVLVGLFVLDIIAHFTGMNILDRLKHNDKLDEKYLWLLNGKIKHK